MGRGGECDLREAGAIQGFLGGSEGKVSTCSVGELGSIPGSGRSPGEGNGNPLWDSCLENPMEGEACQATVHGVAKSQTQLSNFTFTFRFVDVAVSDKIFLIVLLLKWGINYM